MKFKKRVFEIIQIGNKKDHASKAFDYCIVLLIFLNLFSTFFSTFKESEPYSEAIYIVDAVTSSIFLVEYLLRLWTANLLYPDTGAIKSRIKFIISFYGLIDLFAFLPFFIPSVFATGIVAFRIFRVVRIFRLFRINAQYDAYNIITDVLKEKKNQLFSSIVIIFILLMASSLGMYSLEHDAQPDVFENAFSGIWWAVSTLLTVGYGDIYPVTIVGRTLAIIIAFLGVGLVSIPTGIISAGFVEQYSKMRRMSQAIKEDEMNFIFSKISGGHPYIGQDVTKIILPPGINTIMVIRDEKQMQPDKNMFLEEGDILVFETCNAKTVIG